MAYHTLPGDRLALKEYMQVTGLKQFAGWKEQGVIQDYRIYWSRYADSQKNGTPLPSLHSSQFAPDRQATIRMGVSSLTVAALELLGKP